MDYSEERLFLLLESQNPLVMKIIKEDLMQQQRQREIELAVMRMRGGVMHMGLPIESFDAIKLFEEGMKIMSNKDLSREERGNWAKKHLSYQGIIFVQDLANADSEDARAELMKIVSNAEEAYNYTKEGLPKFAVIVSKIKNKPHKVMLVDRFHPENKYEVEFHSATSRVVFLWFLLNAGKEIRHFASVDAFLEKFYYDLQSREVKSFQWKNSITDARNALEDALKAAGEDREDRIAPYVIDNSVKDKNNNILYCLRLPQVLIDTSVLESGSFKTTMDYRYEGIIG